MVTMVKDSQTRISRVRSGGGQVVDDGEKPKVIKRNTLRASMIHKMPDGRHSDGNGLLLVVRASSRLWTCRFTDPLTGKRREISLGAFPEVSLTDARLKRDAVRVQIKAGQRPTPRIEKADASRSLRLWTERTHKAISRRLRHGGPNWPRLVELHLFPSLGDADLTKLTPRNLVEAMGPIWHSKPSSATEIMSRLRIILKHAAAEHSEVRADVVDRAVILLGHQGHKVQHYSALPHAEAPAAYQALGERSIGALAARLLILTASRSRPIRLAKFSDFDLEQKVWSVPAADMKSGRAFRVPLSDEAVEVVQTAMLITRSRTWVFSAREDRPIENSTIWTAISRAGIDCTAHGFRATFRSWCADTSVAYDVAEASLDHVVGTAVSRTYQRSDLLDLRRVVMDDWTAYLLAAPAPA